jgi:hypothetical protein
MNGLAVFPAVALGVGLVGVWGVQEKTQASPPVRTAQATLSFAGQWRTSHGPLTFQVEGGELKATWSGSKGSLQGKIRGHRFEGTFSGTPGEGTLRFVLSSDGRAFFGSWTTRDGQGGPWCGHRVGRPSA